MVKRVVSYLFGSYTKQYMQQFLNNRYVRLGLLTVGIGVVFFLIIFLLCTLLEPLKGFPLLLQFMLAFLGAGALVYKFFSQRII